MPALFFKRKWRIAVWIASIISSILIIISPIITGMYRPKLPYIIPLDSNVNNMVMFGLIVSIASPSIVEYINYKWVRSAELHLSDLFRDLAESVRSGLTLPRAIEEVSKMNYGSLSYELRRVVVMFRLGVEIDKAILKLGERLPSPRVKMASIILSEALKSGGRVNEVLESASKLYLSTAEYEAERITSMKPYVLVIYTAVIIYLAVSYVLVRMFLYPLLVGAQEVTFMRGLLNINFYKSVLYYSSFIESLVGGIIAGKIGTGYSLVGLRHSLILSIISVIIFNLLIL
ncbi:MAG: type II secretion system F family protein [Candidatus Methanomethylicia archaeon]